MRTSTTVGARCAGAIGRFRGVDNELIERSGEVGQVIDGGVGVGAKVGGKVLFSLG
jgi:hypothetical protein